MTRHRILRAVVTKLVLPLGLTLPHDADRPVEYWVLEETLGVEAGAPIAMLGQLVGRVTAREERGDTVFLSVRFNRDAARLPDSRMVRLSRMGPDDEVVLELQVGADQCVKPHPRGGRLELVVDPPAAGLPRTLALPPSVDQRPPSPWRLIPPSPPLPIAPSPRIA